jgi:hypothetical protein
MKRVFTHVLAVGVGIALAVGSGAVAAQNHPADATHSRILARLGNPYIYNAGSLAAEIGDVRREVVSVEVQLLALCQLHGSRC